MTGISRRGEYLHRHQTCDSCSRLAIHINVQQSSWMIDVGRGAAWRSHRAQRRNTASGDDAGAVTSISERVVRRVVQKSVWRSTTSIRCSLRSYTVRLTSNGNHVKRVRSHWRLARPRNPVILFVHDFWSYGLGNNYGVIHSSTVCVNRNHTRARFYGTVGTIMVQKLRLHVVQLIGGRWRSSARVTLTNCRFNWHWQRHVADVTL